MPECDRHDYEDLAGMYGLGLTSQVVDTIRDLDRPADDPVGRQYIPSFDEQYVSEEEMADPIGDSPHTPVKGIVHRYSDRVLLKVSNVCAVYCRYCFRREMVGPNAEAFTDDDLEDALRYVEENDSIWEVILTGGDPLVLSARRLENIMTRLNRIRHVQVVRIHTRIPVADPSKITDTVCSVLAEMQKPVYVVVHINHAQELTEGVAQAFKNLRMAGVSLLSQSVLLKGVNDDPDVLEDLFRSLIVLHVKPYYLHHPDLAKGTSHFRVTLEEGQDIMKDLQGRISGICMPRYVLDIPGGYGKVPVHHGYAQQNADGSYQVEDIDGVIHDYPPVSDEADEDYG